MLLRVDDLTGTHAVAAAIAGLARAGDVIVLAGEMGTGKTAFAQGFGRALGVTEPITSPTFTLVHSYPLAHRLTLHHAEVELEGAQFDGTPTARFPGATLDPTQLAWTECSRLPADQHQRLFGSA